MQNPLLKIMLLLVVAWVVFVLTHEGGHLVGGWLGGGELRSADLYPWHIPYSIFAPDPHPLFTLWMGPVCGAAVPLIPLLVTKRTEFCFVAGFCLLANGSYIALGWSSGDSQLDTTRLLSAGASNAAIALYSIGTIPAGYYLFRKSCLDIFKNAEAFKTSAETQNGQAPPSAGE